MQPRARRWRPRGVAERLARSEPCELRALRPLCVCAVRSTPFLPPLPPWRLWLVWLRVRPRLRDGHVGFAGPAHAGPARDGALQRPSEAGLVGRPDRARAAAGLSTLWAEEAAAWGPRGRATAPGGRRLESGLCLRPAGSCSAEAAAWAGQRSLEPGRREAARAPAWLPGRRAGKVKGTCHPWDLSIREAYGQDSGTSGRRPGMSDFREKPECEDPCSVSVGS